MPSLSDTQLEFKGFSRGERFTGAMWERVPRAQVVRAFVTPEDFPAAEPEAFDIKEPLANFMRLTDRTEYVNRTGRKAPRDMAPMLQFAKDIPAGINYRGSGTTPEVAQ